MSLQVCQASLSDLAWYIQQGQAEYTGATGRSPEKRAYEHSRNGYSGTMYYTSTSNMKRKENELIDMCRTCNNKMRRSGMQQKPGYVYVIVDDSSYGYQDYSQSNDCCIIL